MTGEAWRPRPIYLPDAHLPNSAEPVWTCRQCRTPWPCPTAEPYLTRGQCASCGSPTYWDTKRPRNWHLGPRCYTPADALRAEAEELHQHHQRNPRYPPSHYYPDKPRRRRRQRPPYDHTPSRPRRHRTRHHPVGQPRRTAPGMGRHPPPGDPDHTRTPEVRGVGLARQHRPHGPARAPSPGHLPHPQRRPRGRRDHLPSAAQTPESAPARVAVDQVDRGPSPPAP